MVAALFFSPNAVVASNTTQYNIIFEKYISPRMPINFSFLILTSNRDFFTQEFCEKTLDKLVWFPLCLEGELKISFSTNSKLTV